jgi:hypothetical protein
MNINSFFHPGVVEILNFDSFGPLKSCEGGGVVVHGNQAYTLSTIGRTLIWRSYIQQHGGQTLLVTNDETEFKILTFRTY